MPTAALIKKKKQAVVTVKMEEELKQKAGQVFLQLGLTPSQAVKMFYSQVVMQDGLPFSPKVNKNSEDSRKILLQMLDEFSNARTSKKEMTEEEMQAEWEKFRKELYQDA